MSSVRQVAKEARVSPATVSRTLNNPAIVSRELRDRVMSAVQRVGYEVPTRTVQLDRIGVVYTGMPVHSEFGGFDAAILSAAAQASIEDRYDSVIVSLEAQKTEGTSYTEFFKSLGIRGAVIRSNAEDRSACEQIAEEGFPAVVIGDHFDNPAVNFVSYDSTDDSKRAVQHLIDLGHRRIALCVHVVHDSDHDERRNAYLEVLADRGIEHDPELTIEVVADADGGAAAVSRLLSLPEPPTAVFFTDPLSTAGGIRRALEIGVKIPEELSIVGFDDGALRKLTYPPYTAVCQDASRLARIATKWLTAKLRGTASSADLRLRNRTFFEVNRTTDAAPERAVRVSPGGTRLGLKGAIA
ncbi:MAG: LacI family DNA-binding transcriptional regulator [Planctomycetota bacterium]